MKIAEAIALLMFSRFGKKTIQESLATWQYPPELC